MQVLRLREGDKLMDTRKKTHSLTHTHNKIMGEYENVATDI